MKPVRSWYKSVVLTPVTVLLLTACGAVERNQEKLTPRTDRSSVTVAMRKQPPLHERGVATLGVLYEPMGGIDLLAFGRRSDDLERDRIESERFIPRGEVEALLLSRINGSPHVRGRLLEDSETAVAAHLEWPSEWRPRVAQSGRAILQDLRARGIDAVLLVQDVLLSDIYFGVHVPERDDDHCEEVDNFLLFAACVALLDSESPKPSNYGELGAKGVYWRPDKEHPRVFSGFRVSVIDTAASQDTKNASYTQASDEVIVGLRWKGAFASYTPEEQKLIVEAVKQRIVYNIGQALLMAKVLPLQGDEFITFTPESLYYDERIRN